MRPKLAHFLRSGDPVEVSVPAAQNEAMRDLERARGASGTPCVSHDTSYRSSCCCTVGLLAAEMGDFARFSTPRQRMGFSSAWR
jgi:hypothetical protein